MATMRIMANRPLVLGIVLIVLGYAWNFVFGFLIRELPKYRRPGVSTVQFVWIGQAGLIILLITGWSILIPYFNRVSKSRANKAPSAQSSPQRTNN
jgi:hypothetical protein